MRKWMVSDNSNLSDNSILTLRQKFRKIGFPMPTAKNGFQILNLHPKKHRIRKILLMYFKYTFTHKFVTKTQIENLIRLNIIPFHRDFCDLSWFYLSNKKNNCLASPFSTVDSSPSDLFEAPDWGRLEDLEGGLEAPPPTGLLASKGSFSSVLEPQSWWTADFGLWGTWMDTLSPERGLSDTDLGLFRADPGRPSTLGFSSSDGSLPSGSSESPEASISGFSATGSLPSAEADWGPSAAGGHSVSASFAGAFGLGLNSLGGHR